MMEFLNRTPTSRTPNSRHSVGMRDFGYNSLQLPVSPMMSRRRSASPLLSPANGTMTMSPQLLQRNRQESIFPQTEDETLLTYQEKIMFSQEKTLLPLAHDIADWLNSILGVGLVPSNLMQKLETGVILFDLAKLIEERASLTESVQIKPTIKGKVRPNASPKSFFARDNISIFLRFCRDLGVHSTLLFETEDLVSHGELRSVLVCLFEVGRIVQKFGMDPPALVAMEQEIDNARQTDTDQTDSSHHEEEDENKENPALVTESNHTLTTSSADEKTNLSDSIDSGLPVEEVEIPQQNTKESKPEEPFKATTDLDIKVSEISRITGKHCSCVEETRKNFELRKLSEGKYRINNRIIFVRLLKSVYPMVRVGGGWVALDEFLVKNDPCRAKKNSFIHRRASFGVSPSSPSWRPSSSPPVIGSNNLRSTSCSPSTCSTPTRSRYSSRNSVFH